MTASINSMLPHKLGLGTVQFGLKYGISNTTGQTSPQEVSNILQYASINGITVLDTAAAYGNAEEILGKNDPGRFTIVSKYITPSAENSIERQFKHSLDKLQVKSLYGYLAHRPAEILKDKQQWKTLKELQQKGSVQKIGFSLNATEELEALLNKGFIPDLVQAPFNYLDNRFENLMSELKEKGCEIHTRSAFLQGLFFKDTNELSSFFDTIKPIVKRIQAQTKNISGALLHFVCSKEFIDKVIIGVENVQQLQTNISDLQLAIELEKNHSKVANDILMPSAWPKQ